MKTFVTDRRVAIGAAPLPLHWEKRSGDRLVDRLNEAMLVQKISTCIQKNSTRAIIDSYYEWMIPAA
jgi:hypothetical protein